MASGRPVQQAVCSACERAAEVAIGDQWNWRRVIIDVFGEFVLDSSMTARNSCCLPPGIDCIDEVMTDNHWSYTKSNALAAHIGQLSAKHIPIKPHWP